MLVRAFSLLLVLFLGLTSSQCVWADDDDWIQDSEPESESGYSTLFGSHSITPIQFEVPPSPPIDGDAQPDWGENDFRRRFQEMEQQNQNILRRMELLDPLHSRIDDLSNQLGTLSKKKSDPSGLAGPGGFKPRPPETNIQSGQAQESASRATPARSTNAQDVGNRYLGKIPLSTFLDYGRDGIGMETADGEFTLKFRALAQMDFLNYGPTKGATPFDSGFYLPRSRFYFHGNYTKPIGYMLSFQQSYTQFGFLDVFTNVQLNEHVAVRVGRFKVPFEYEWFKESAWNFITPERSPFAGNFGLNRQVGGMLWGQLLDQKVEYAAGIFDGTRNSSQDYNSQKDVATFLNLKPFTGDESFLENLAFGGSFAYGIENNPLTPAILRTNTNATSDTTTSTNPVNNATVPFLAFNSGVVERGQRTLYDLHLAYFYRGISFIGSYGFGSEGYQNTTPGNSQVNVPISGYSATIAYLLTGETMSERTIIDPISRFDRRDGKRGYGAWEPYFRYSNVNISDKIFTQNIANGSLWTDKLNMTDTGVNWYLNRGVKVYFDWEHAMFGSPNSYGTGAHAMSNDLFWTRVQFYF